MARLTLNLVFIVMVTFLMYVSFQPDTMTNAIPFLVRCRESECKSDCEEAYGSHLIKSYCKKTIFGSVCDCDHTNYVIKPQMKRTTIQHL
ncbi:hypothetical protein ABFS82_06G191800 [Erythranthe guttata]